MQTLRILPGAPSCGFAPTSSRGNALSVTAARLLAAAALLWPAFVMPLAAQQCRPAGGGSPCETADGMASLGDPDGGDLAVGNPFHPITGNKYQEELDAPALPGFLGLEIRRHFNAAYVSQPSPWGRGWTLSYDTRLFRHGSTLQIVQADGRRLLFGMPPAAGRDAAQQCAAASPGQGELTLEREGFRWRWPQQREISFDAGGRLVAVGPRSASVAESVRIERDTGGRIVRITDPLGRSLQIDYDGNGHLSRIEHPLGTWRYQVDDSGRLQSVTAPDGATRRYRYEDPGNLHRFTAITMQPPGEGEAVVAQWDYDARGRVVSHRRADGGELRMDYQQSSAAASGRFEAQSQLTNAGGERTRYRAVEVAGRWRVTEITGPGCEECGPTNLRMRYDSRGLLVARRRIGGDGIAFQRDAQGRVVRMSRLDATGTAASDYLLRFEYADEQTLLPRLLARPSVVPGKEHRIVLSRDERGNLLEYLESGYAPGLDGAPWQPIVRKTVLRYRVIAARRVLAEVDGPLPNGPTAAPADSDITRLRYDELGRFLQMMELPGGWWRRVVERDAAGRELVSLSGDGHREVEERQVLDYRHRWLELRRAAWLAADGRRQAERAVAAVSSRRFGPLGHLLHWQDAAGRRMSYRHDLSGRLLGFEDGRGYRTELRRDAEGRVVATLLFEPGSPGPRRAVYFGRNRNGRLETLLLPDGRRFRLHYDVASRPVAIAGSDGSVRLAARPSNPRGGTSTLVDDFGRPVRQMLPDHGSRTVRYDEAGRPVELIDAAGTTFSFRHDVAGRLMTRTISGPAGEEAVDFGWQGALLVRAVDPVQTTRWTHDAVGRILSLSVQLAGLPGEPLRITRAWDAVAGPAIEQGLADGQTLSISHPAASHGDQPRQLQLRSRFWSAAHDWLDRLLPSAAASRVAGLLPAVTLARDAVVHPLDGLTGLTFFNGGVMSRTVDAAGRTVRLLGGHPDRPAAHWRYHYAGGSRIARIEKLGPLAGERPAGDGDVPPAQQDAPPSEPGVGLVLDRAGRVVADGRFRYAFSVRGQLEAVTDLRGRLVATYAYNHRGQRVRKTVHAAEGAGPVTRYFLWDEEALVAEIAPDGAIVTQYVAIDDGRRRIPIVQLQAGAPGRALRAGRASQSILAIHSDHRGAPVALTDERGRLAWQARVGPWGTATVQAKSGGAGTNLRLPGQYFDAETGLHDNWHRSYDPRRGRYLQPDPLGYPDGADAYAYAGGDPINRADPAGLYEIDVHYYMTFFLGVTAGLDPEEARIVALAAQYVDDNPLTSPVDAGGLGTTAASVLGNQARLLGYHFVLSGNDGRTQPPYRNDRLDIEDSPQLANLLRAARTAGLGRNASLQLLGEYLHALADTYAHRDARNIPYDALVLGCGVGHGLAGHEPDLTYDDVPGWSGVVPGVIPIGRTPWRREARTLAMELELHGVLLAVGDRARAQQASEIAATLREFNAIRESEGRGADFAGKIGLLQSRLAALGYGHLDLRDDERYGYNEGDARNNRLVFLRNSETGTPLREEDFPGVCLEGGTRCRIR